VGAIHENQNDYHGAIEEYLRSMSQDRLIQLAHRKQTAGEIEQRTAELVAAKPFNPAAFRLRLALLEDRQRRDDIRALLSASVEKIADLDQMA